jgi:hypothetical protein
MWLAVVLIAIACGETVFMVRFLIALLRAGAPSVCYWVIPERTKEDYGTAQASEFDGGVEIGRSRLSHATLSRAGISHAELSHVKKKAFAGWRVVNSWEAGTRILGSNQGGKL